MFNGVIYAGSLGGKGGKLVGGCGDRVICRKREGEWREFYATWTWKLFTHGCTAKRRKNKGGPLEGGIPKKWQLFNTRPRHLFVFFFCHPYTSNSASVFSPKCEKFFHYTVCRSSDWVNRGDMVREIWRSWSWGVLEHVQDSSGALACHLNEAVSLVAVFIYFPSGEV